MSVVNIDSDIVKLGLKKDDVTGKWLYGRRAIAEALGTTEWYVRKVLGAARLAVGGTNGMTPEQLHERQVTQEVLRHPEVVINLPKRRQIKPVKRDAEVWLIGSDFHAPYQHAPTCEIFYQIAEDLKPDAVYLLGDVVNLDAFSKYDKPPSHKTWLDDVVEGGKVLANVKHASPNSHLEWITGNHETRLKRYLMSKDPLLFDVLDMNKLFYLVDQDGVMDDWAYTDQQEVIFQDLKLALVHGHKIRKHSGMTAFAHMDDLWLSVVNGHSHRMGLHYKTSGRTRYLDEPPTVGIECGCMCRLDQEYTSGKTNNWQHGFVVLYIHYPPTMDEHPLIEPKLVSVVNRQASFEGKLYKA